MLCYSIFAMRSVWHVSNEVLPLNTKNKTFTHEKFVKASLTIENLYFLGRLMAVNGDRYRTVDARRTAYIPAFKHALSLYFLAFLWNVELK